MSGCFAVLDDVMSTHILLADDEEAITSELAPFLERSGFVVTVAHAGDEVVRIAEQSQPDLLVLDILMPQVDGREVCRRLRAVGNQTPVIMLTQVGTSAERAMTLEEGADDYLNKPFDPLELVSRIRAVLRRSSVAYQSLASSRRLVSGTLVLDRPARQATFDGRALPLTAKAFAVLEYLMLHQDEVLRRDRLLDEVWGWDYPAATRAVDIRIAELRKALGDDADQPRYIETRVGEGYRFVAPVHPGS
jgi:DNA-binding response OmpR family regulator